jgi:hypothetical protein
VENNPFTVGQRQRMQRNNAGTSGQVSQRRNEQDKFGFRPRSVDPKPALSRCFRSVHVSLPVFRTRPFSALVSSGAKRAEKPTTGIKTRARSPRNAGLKASIEEQRATSSVLSEANGEEEAHQEWCGAASHLAGSCNHTMLSQEKSRIIT